MLSWVLVGCRWERRRQWSFTCAGNLTGNHYTSSGPLGLPARSLSFNMCFLSFPSRAISYQFRNVVGLSEGDINRKITECLLFYIYISCCITVISLENSGSSIHKVPRLEPITGRAFGSSCFIFRCTTAQRKFSAHCVRATGWASRALQLGGVESMLPDIMI